MAIKQYNVHGAKNRKLYRVKKLNPIGVENLSLPLLILALYLSTVNYLISIVGALNPEEKKKVFAAKVTGLEETVLDAAIKVADGKLNGDKFTPELFDISRSHFDKINSVLTKKIYAALTDGTFRQISDLLQVKGLMALHLHEIALENRRIKDANKAAKKEFYIIAFEAIRRLSMDQIDLKQLKKYAELLKPLLDKKDLLTPKVMDLKYLYIENTYYFYYGKSIEYGETALNNIIAVLPKPDKYLGKPEYSHFHLCLGTYYRDYKTEHNKAVEHMRLVIHNEERSGIKDQPFYVNAHGMLAVMLAQDSQFKEAWQIYHGLYKNYVEIIAKSQYHNYLYSNVALVAGEYADAKRHMDIYTMPMLAPTTSLYFKFDAWRLYALYYMYVKDYKTAYENIKQMHTMKRSDMTMAGDVMLRMLENVYFLITKEWDVAIALSKKNLKYLKSKDFNFNNSEYTHLFYCCGELAKMNLRSKVQPEKLTAHLKVCRSGLLKLFGGLLDQAM